MPRREEPDPLAAAIGKRIRELREEKGLTLEKLAYESDLGSKGYLSDIERGLALPSLTTLQVIAEGIEVEVFDLLVFPEEGERQRLVNRTRRAGIGKLRRALKSLE